MRDFSGIFYLPSYLLIFWCTDRIGSLWEGCRKGIWDEMKFLLWLRVHCHIAPSSSGWTLRGTPGYVISMLSPFLPLMHTWTFQTCEGPPGGPSHVIIYKSKNVHIKKYQPLASRVPAKLFGWQHRCQSYCRASIICQYIVLPKWFYTNILESLQ